MPIEMLGEPGGDRRAQRILNPAAHGFPFERRDAGDVESGGAEKRSRISLGLRLDLPQPIQVSQPVLEPVPGIAGPVTELGVEVVMEIALPGREAAVVRGPDGLEGDGRRPAAGRGAEFISLEIPLLLEKRVGQGDGGPGPEPAPPEIMGFEIAGQAPAPGGTDSLGRGRPDGSPRGIGGADRPDSREAPVVGTPPFDDDVVGHPAPALLTIADGRGLRRDARRWIIQSGEALAGDGIRRLAARRGSGSIGGRDEPRRRALRQTLEFEPAHRLGRMDEGPEPRPTFPDDLAHGLPERQPDALDLAQAGDIELQGPGRDLGGSGIALVGNVAQLLDGRVIFLQNLLAHPGEPEFGPVETLHRPEVPEVGPVEGETNRVPLPPDERADEAVAERQALVPGRGQAGEDQIVPGGRARGRFAGLAAGDRRQEDESDRQPEISPAASRQHRLISLGEY